MKVIIACALVFIMGCYDGIRVDKNERIGYVDTYHFTESGMRYVLFQRDNGGVCVINITKDSLEVGWLKQINKKE